MAEKIDLLAIVGPTASGKTSLSIKIAKKFNGEIIAADSRTVYKFLDIGTAKPSITEQDGIRHWGLDIVGPGQNYSAASFKKYATNAISEIKARVKLPIIVGGSGLYVDAVLYDFEFAPANIKYRNTLEAYGNLQLQKMIKDKGLIMPENINNKRYLIRTLEKGAHVPSKKKLKSGYLIVGINPGKEQIKKRIEKRALAMIELGVVDEIKQAYRLYDEESEALNGGIYKSFKPFVDGKMSQENAVENFVNSDLRLYKKQMTWFKRNKDIVWYESANVAYKAIVNNHTLG